MHERGPRFCNGGRNSAEVGSADISPRCILHRIKLVERGPQPSIISPAVVVFFRLNDVHDRRKYLASAAEITGSSSIAWRIPPSSLVYPYSLRKPSFSAG